MAKDLPNGFTGFSKREPGFESAAEALRRAKNAQEYGKIDVHSSNSYDAQDGLDEKINPSVNSKPINKSGNHQSRNMFGGSATNNLWQSDDSFLPGSINKYLSSTSDGTTVSAATFNDEALSEIPRSKRRWAWVEINLGAINHNLLAIKKLLSPNTMVMAVVKADAYGHGAVQCAKTAIYSGAEYLGVATVDEGVQLRKAGIGVPILILAEPPATSIPLLLAYDLMPSIYTIEFAIQYGEAADNLGRPAPYHLKVNTGMNRIGVRYDEVVDFLKRIAFHRALDLVGTYTHFATADQSEEMEFRLQVSHFEECIAKMREAGIDPGIVHAANSAAIIRFPETHYDMVRLGISLYGYYPCYETYGQIDLIPAMSVHSRITQVKTVPVGEGVSYGLNYRSGGFAKICTVPIGYADGLKRDLSDRIDFILGDRQFPQVGTICMDQAMFEVALRSRRSQTGSGKYDPQIGDEVLIVGSRGNAVVTIDEMAEKLHTIPHEVAIGFGCSRMPRVFV